MPDTPRYCSSCGSRLSPSDNFCSACGSDVSDDSGGGRRSRARDGDYSSTSSSHGTTSSSHGTTSSSHSSTSNSHSNTTDDQTWLRKRVEDLRMDGWEVTRDTGDRVVLVNKGIGSIPVHILLFFVSSGLANVLYGWYSWTMGAPKREVTADGSERVLNESSLGSVVVGLVLLGLLGMNMLLLLIALVFGAELVALVFGLLSLLVVGAGVGVTRDVDTQSLSTFGRERSVSTESVRTPSEPCASCGSRVIEGERRTFTDRLYVAGLPVKTYKEGDNTYCAECAGNSDISGPDDIDAELENLRRERDRRDHERHGSHDHSHADRDSDRSVERN